MPRSSGSRLISEIGVGGQGGRNIASDENHENQNWWTSKMPSCPPTTTTSPIELAITSSPIKTDCSQLNTNHIIDYNTLSKFLKEDMYCKSCVNKFVKEYCKQSLRDFVTYFKSNRNQKLSILYRNRNRRLEIVAGIRLVLKSTIEIGRLGIRIVDDSIREP